MPDNPADPETVEMARFVCRVIDDGHFSLSLKWGSVVEIMEQALDIKRETVIEALKTANVGFTEEKDADFLVAGIYDATVGHGVEEKISARVLSIIGSDPIYTNLLMLISTEYDFTLALLEFLFRKPGHHLDHFRDSPLLPIITSDTFIESKASNRFVKELLKKMEVDFGRIRELVRNDWFMDLMTILKSEINVNPSSGFIKLIDREAHTMNPQEIMNLISDGTMEMVVFNRNTVLKQKFVSAAFLKRYEAEHHEKKLRRFYYWLGIANDFILGVEFLIGSIEFFPGMPQGSLLIGVVLFTIGSSQLVARSVIQIVMNLHIRSSRKKKMQELPN